MRHLNRLLPIFAGLAMLIAPTAAIADGAGGVYIGSGYTVYIVPQHFQSSYHIMLLRVRLICQRQQADKATYNPAPDLHRFFSLKHRIDQRLKRAGLPPSPRFGDWRFARFYYGPNRIESNYGVCEGAP